MLKLKLGQIVYLASIFRGVDTKKLLETSPKTVVFLDGTPAKAEIEALLAAGVEVIVRDHHGCSPRDQSRFSEARECLGECARIVTRAEMPACAGLVELGEFISTDTVIFADSDLDGYLTVLKAVGITYPELENDSVVLDGPRENKTQQNLSSTGWLMLQAYNAARDNDELKTQVFSLIMQHIQGATEATDKLLAIVENYQTLVQPALDLVKSAVELIPDVWYVDTTASVPYDRSTYNQQMESKAGCKVVVTKRTDGKVADIHGVQYSLSVPGTQKGKIDLTQLISLSPEQNTPTNGVVSHQSFALHCSQQLWDEKIWEALKTYLSDK